MKLKKLLRIMKPTQAIKLATTNGSVTKKSEVTRIDSCYYFSALIDSLSEYKVVSIRSVHDDLQLPDFQDYIEITLIGGNDND